MGKKRHRLTSEEEKKSPSQGGVKEQHGWVQLAIGVKPSHTCSKMGQLTLGMRMLMGGDGNLRHGWYHSMLSISFEKHL